MAVSPPGSLNKGLSESPCALGRQPLLSSQCSCTASQQELPRGSSCDSQDFSVLVTKRLSSSELGLGCGLRIRSSYSLPGLSCSCGSSQLGCTPAAQLPPLWVSVSPSVKGGTCRGLTSELSPGACPGAKGKKSACGDKGLLMTGGPAIPVPNSRFRRCLVAAPLALSLMGPGLRGSCIWAATESRRVRPHHKCSFPGTCIHARYRHSPGEGGA